MVMKFKQITFQLINPQPNMNGKGSKRRKEDIKRFLSNYDKINWNKKEVTQIDSLKILIKS